MEIFNIHIFEFLLIAGLALVVFGPERLPEVGRFLGQQVARFLAWQQQSPELKMLNDIRGEFESEIASLRDELTRTRKELDVQQEMAALREELKPMLDLRSDLTPTTPADAAPLPADALADAAQTIAPSPSDVLAEAAQTIAPSPSDVLAEAAQTIAPSPSDVLAEAAQTIAPSPSDVLAEAAQTIAPEIRPASQSVTAAMRPNRMVAVEPTNVLQLPPVEPALASAEVTAEPYQNGHTSAAPVPEVTPAMLLAHVEALQHEMQTLVQALQARGLLDNGAWDAAPPNPSVDKEPVA
jgi:sec-independent protein translocase protein TatB